MVVRHTTLRSNLESIQQHGLDPELAVGKIKGSWCHTPSKTPWAILHTMKRHGGNPEDVVTIELDIPRGWLRRRNKCLWTIDRRVSSARFVRVIESSEIYCSPMEDLT